MFDLFKKQEKPKYKFKRIFLIVLDSVGIGEADDAYDYEDIDCNTLLHTLQCTTHKYHNLEEFGLYDLLNDTNSSNKAYYCKANPMCKGKDTLTGHLEMMGINTKIPFKTFPDGFPDELIKELEKNIGRKVIGNCVASGTEIIEKLGEEHMKTGNIIVYTSADSVLQIAAHEDVVPLSELYDICLTARKLTLSDEFKVGRVIARPFKGTPGNFERTCNRHDFSLDPNGITVLDSLMKSHYDVLSIGKIADIFNNKGITLSAKTKNNTDGIKRIIEALRKDFTGLCFANLNDFDSLYGHRRNVVGYADALREFDDAIPHFLNYLNDDDLLIITADHGNDPTYRGTDHTREKVPVLIYSQQFKQPKRLENLSTFADIGATIAENFAVNKPSIGTSFLKKLK